MNTPKFIKIPALLHLALVLIVVVSCDFKPERSPKTYTGQEPVIDVNVTGLKGKRLIISGISTLGYQDFTNTSDTLKAEYYSSNYSGDLVKIYTTPDSLSHSYSYGVHDKKNGILKILNYDGLKISGDLSNGISLKNVRQTPADELILRYRDKLSYLSSKLTSTIKDTFNYPQYLQTHKKIKDYIQNSVDSINWGDLRTTYQVLAAQEGLLSQEYFGKKLFWPADDDLVNKRLSKAYIHTVRKLPPISINNEIKDYLLSDTYDENPFFKKGNSQVLKMVITNSYSDNEKLILEELTSNLKQRFGNALKILIIPAGDSYINPKELFIRSMYETLLDGRDRRGYTQVDALQATILDQNNTVLLNTTADAFLEKKIAGILTYLKSKDSTKESL